MRVSTKYGPRKSTNGQPLTCTAETTLKPEQLLELYRYLKLTRLVEERLVNLYRQTKVVGGVFRSLGQEATAPPGSNVAQRIGSAILAMTRFAPMANQIMLCPSSAWWSIAGSAPPAWLSRWC